jgi:type IV pilus assembly protein PilM
VDSHILKEDLPDNKMLVLLAAVRKDFLNQRMKIIEDAGLKVNLVDIDSICLINAFNFNYSQEKENIGNKAIALLNIGAAASNLDILEEGVPRLSRNINIAGNNFTQKLADALGSDFKSAENLKLNADADKIDRINTAVESTLTNLASEIRTSFDYYESQCAANVSKIFLSGGGSKIPGLKDMLKNLLGMEVESWDCLKQINISSNINPEEAKAFSNQLAVAVGLALRS